MDAWKEMKFSYEDVRISRSLTRASALAKQHTPFIAFLAFASFVLLCMQLPWGHPIDSAVKGGANGNQTIPPGGGTLEFFPQLNRTGPPRFAKIAVASGFEDILYEKALQTHFDHAEKHGYPMYMAREQAADGMFNKIAYIMTVLLNELYKPADERVEWLFYFDADSIIMNQEIPLNLRAAVGLQTDQLVSRQRLQRPECRCVPVAGLPMVSESPQSRHDIQTLPSHRRLHLRGAIDPCSSYGEGRCI